MEDVRVCLGVKSLRWKIEKRCLERIGHVSRMEDGRVTKALVFGWMKELERWPKVSGRLRKMMHYWRKLAREAGIDASNVSSLASDRKGWRRLAKERMDHLADYEKSRCKR